jgi:hypothetical protein
MKTNLGSHIASYGHTSRIDYFLPESRVAYYLVQALYILMVLKPPVKVNATQSGDLGRGESAIGIKKGRPQDSAGQPSEKRAFPRNRFGEKPQKKIRKEINP